MDNQNSEPTEPLSSERFLDIKVIQAENGRSLLRLEVEGKHVHSEKDPRVGGGVILSLADAAAHHAIASLLEDGELHATVEVKMNFISPGSLGVLEAEGVIIHKGRRISVSQVTIRQGDRLIAKAQGTETSVKISP